MDHALEKEFKDAAKGRDSDACRVAAGSSSAAMNVPFIHCTPAAASRILYCNPVCFLSTVLPSSLPQPAPFNVMAISWMAPANSYGGLLFCIKKSRASFAAMQPGAVFGLSVATSNQTELLLQVGGTSARAGPKLARIPDVTRCRFANAKAAASTSAGSKRARNSFAALASESDEDDGSAQQKQQQKQEEEEEELEAAIEGQFFISSSCAHITARVLRIDDAADAGHALVVAQVNCSPGILIPFPLGFAFMSRAAALRAVTRACAGRESCGAPCVLALRRQSVRRAA